MKNDKFNSVLLYVCVMNKTQHYNKDFTLSYVIKSPDQLAQ